MKSHLSIIGIALLAVVPHLALAKLTPDQVKSLPPPVSRTVNFSQDIKPILEASCVKCHGRGRAKGDLRLDTRDTLLNGSSSGPAVVPGKSEESYLIELVAGIDPENMMPKKGSKLTPQQISLLRAWIDQGLPWDKGVSFAKHPPLNLIPKSPEIPPARNGSGLTNPIDRLLQSYFELHQVKWAEAVEDRIYARRVYLDIIGLLPTPELLEAFMADKRPDKQERLVERLLRDNLRYAEHWLSFWNDALRNDYRGTGYIDGGRKQISTWLFSALAKNLPYDQFVAQLVNPTEETDGFTKGIIWRGAVNASQIPQMQAAQNISQVFMGVNLKCASCHDSFINDWTLQDAYGVANVYSETPLEMFECDKPTGKKAGVKFLYPELGEIEADTPKTERQKRLAEILTQKENGRLTRTIVNRLWAKLIGRGLVEPVDDMEQPAWHGDVLDWLAEDLAAHGYDLKQTLKMILTSRAYQLPVVSLDEQKREYVFRGPAVRRMSAEQFRDALGTLTGIWHQTPATQFDFTAGAPEARWDSELTPRPAKWVWSDSNAVQRARPETIYFRRVLTLAEMPDEAFAVAACDNSYTLYVNGEKVVSGKDFNQPNFVDIRSRLKKGENLFAVTAVNHLPDNKPPSAEYKPQEADANPTGFLFYGRIRRAGEVLDFTSDSAWLWSAEVKADWEKPEFMAENWKPAIELGGTALAPWNLEKKLAQVMSLALVHGQARASLVAADPLMTALGRPPREQVITGRPSAATTLQTLELTNGETLSKLLKRGAQKLLGEKPASSTDLVRQLYTKALGREPTTRELRLAKELLGEPLKEEQVEDLLWSVAMLPEFQLVY